MVLDRPGPLTRRCGVGHRVVGERPEPVGDEVDDPVDVLFGVQLGGGTDINRALAYCEGLIERPDDTIVVLISDLYEGGIAEETVDDAVVLLHRVHHHPEELVEHVHHLARLRPHRHLRGADDVHKDHADPGVTSAQLRVVEEERISRHWWRSPVRYTVEYTVRNARPEPVTVELRQRAPWRRLEIVEQSHPGRRDDSRLISWSVPVPAQGETTVTAVIDTGY